MALYIYFWFYWPFILAWCLPFFSSYLVRGVKSLLFYALAWGSITYCLYYDLSNAPHDKDGNGFASAMAIGIIMLTAAATAAGFISRATIFFLRKVNCSKFWQVIVLWLAFLSFIPFIYFPQLHHKWKHRAPDTACKHEKLLVHIGDKTLSMPPLSFFSFFTGDGSQRVPNKVPETNYYFMSNMGLRKFCDDFDNGNKKIIANAARISFSRISKLESSPLILDKKLCEEDSTWPRDLCKHRYHEAYFPQDINLYVAGKYKAGNMGMRDLTTQNQYMQKSASLKLSKNYPDFKYDEYEHYWQSLETKNPDGTPFTMRCRLDTPIKEKINCTTEYSISENVNVGYHMRLDPSNMEKEIMLYKANVEKVLTFGGLKQSPVPRDNKGGR